MGWINRAPLALVLLASSVLAAEPIVTESRVETTGEVTTNVNTPPPSAISPQFSAGSNSDLCTVGVAGAVQTQILGISAGTTFTEESCVLLRQSKTLFDMGMKTAAVARMCQDKNVFDAMMNAGTPCPYDGMIGADARAAWKANEELRPQAKKDELISNDQKKLWGIGGILSALGWLILL
jgi:hypothetical protein